MSAVWTDVRKKQLADLWAKGATANEIAAELGGVSRSSVLGKVHRMGLSTRVERISSEEAKLRLDKRRMHEAARRHYRQSAIRGYGTPSLQIESSTAPQKNKPKAVPMFEGSLNIAFIDLRNFSEIYQNQCRFIEGDAPPYAACGNVTPDGGSYCRHHRALVYGGGRELPRLSESERNRRAALVFKRSQPHMGASRTLRSGNDGGDLLGTSSI